ncbi:MAG: hybrid sensor histidine kinase/response regulator [Campylobacterota bacterium]|nr:hybrid sensor histidine kinase/response regulator [Campylobacterota bacterium]
MYQDFNLLYVEDEVSLKEITCGVLNRFFNKVYTKENGKEGLEFYKENKNKIDLIITDINMPKMNGIDMSEQIKLIDPSIPIIVTSAHNDNDYLLKSINIGINGYIIKPININNLVKTIGKVLEPKVLKKKLKDQEEENQQRLLKSAKFTAIGQLTAGLTHEINTPLTYIKGSVEIMQHKMKALPDLPVKQTLEKQYDRIEDGVKRISNIIDSMTEMAKKSSERSEFANIYETMIVSIIMAYNRSKHITQIYINGEPFCMNMDKNKQTFEAFVQRQRVEQVWIIIINNALDELIKIVDFKDRSLNIIIEDDKNNVKIKFEDNAGGIKDEIFDTLFEPFKSTKESSGMGVGLSIAKKIIEEQHGVISAYNKNDGAVFEVVLPKGEIS